jgi:hypothetical protein
LGFAPIGFPHPLDLVEIDAALRVKIDHNLTALAHLPLALLQTDHDDKDIAIK